VRGRAGGLMDVLHGLFESEPFHPRHFDSEAYSRSLQFLAVTQRRLLGAGTLAAAAAAVLLRARR
jgi:hypothetical protein